MKALILILSFMTSVAAWAESKTQLHLKLEAEGKVMEFAPIPADAGSMATVESQATQGPRKAVITIRSEQDMQRPTKSVFHFTVEYTGSDRLSMTSYMVPLGLEVGEQNVTSVNAAKPFTLTARLVERNPVKKPQESETPSQTMGTDIKPVPSGQFLVQ